MNKQPEQTAMTKKKIVDSFLSLAKKQGIDKVSITEVMKLAGYNRGTFYLYFSDINDLIVKIEKEIISDFHIRVSAIKDDISALNFQEASNKVAHFLSIYDEQIFLLLSSKGDPRFYSALQSEAHRLVSGSFHELDQHPYKEYMVASYSSAILGLLTYWHNTGRKVPADKIVAHMENLWMNGLKNVIIDKSNGQA